MKGSLAAGLIIASAPPHQKVGDFHTRRRTLALIRATPRRAVVRGLLAKIASAEWDDINYAAYQARKITLSKGMLPPVAAVVAAKLADAYPDNLRKQTQDAFMAKRKTRHAAAQGAIARGEAAAKALGGTI